MQMGDLEDGLSPLGVQGLKQKAPHFCYVGQCSTRTPEADQKQSSRQNGGRGLPNFVRCDQFMTHACSLHDA